MVLIVGLGNPGSKYESTRHNVGFVAVDYLAHIHNIKVSKLKFRSLYGEGVMHGEQVMLVKPQTFMNLSGEAVRDFMQYFKVDNAHLVVIYDDVSLPPGRLRVRPQGSAGGHNGIKNIIYHLGSDEFARVKIGVGAPAHEQMDMADHVLGRITGEDGVKITSCIKMTDDVLYAIFREGVSGAMNRYNGG